MSEQATLLNRMRDRRLECWEQMKGVQTRAFEEKNRPLTGEEQRIFDEYDAEIVAIDDKVQAMLAGEKRALDTESAIAKLLAQPPTPGVPGSADGPGLTYEAEQAEFRKLIGSTPGSGLDLPWPSTFERRTLTRGSLGGFTMGGMESRALADASVPMPTSFIHQLYVYLVDTSSIRQAGATVISTTTGESILVPRSTAEGAALWTAEGGTLSASDPTLSSITLGAHKLGKLVQVSKELATDVGFDLVGYLAQSCGRNIGIATNAAYVSGTGTTQPLGLLGQLVGGITGTAGAGGLVGFPTAAGGDIQFDWMVDLYHSIIPQYRPRAAWMMNDATIKYVRKLKDTLNRYLWEPSLQAGVADTVLGKPVYANPAFPLFGANNIPIVFGDFSAYYIRDVTPLRFERSDEYAFGTDQISFRALMRTDGNLVDTNAVKAYVCPAT